MVAEALGGAVPEARSSRRSSRGGDGYVISTYAAGAADALALEEMARPPTKREVFEALCVAATSVYPHHTTNSAHHLPVSCLLLFVDEDTAPQTARDSPMVKALRDYPPLRASVATFKPFDPRGLEFAEFDELDQYFNEILTSNCIKPY